MSHSTGKKARKTNKSKEKMGSIETTASEEMQKYKAKGTIEGK